MKRKDVDMDYFLELYHSGMDVKQMSKLFGINTTTIYDWLKVAGVPTRRRCVIDTTEMLTLYNSGMSGKQLADHFGVGATTIHRRLAGLGLATTKRIVVDVDQIVARYVAGTSVKVLAEEFGVAPSVVMDRLGERGISLRNRSDAMYIRMAHTSPEERSRLTDSAHAAIRGVRHTEEHRCKIAKTRENIRFKVSRTEDMFVEMLNDRGISCTQQKAFGRYNVDITIDECPIAVEINGGGWHGFGAHAARYAERTKYILDQGVHLVVIWINTSNSPLESGAADYVVALAGKLGSQKPIRGEEHMIRGDGQSTSIGQRKFNDLPVIPCSERRDNITGRFESCPFDETIKM